MDEHFFEVLFHNYCKKCKHYGLPETEEPCRECIEENINFETRKPIKFEEK